MELKLGIYSSFRFGEKHARMNMYDSEDKCSLHVIALRPRPGRPGAASSATRTTGDIGTQQAV